ncbi:MAG: formylglycine-generating enzyme family protein [Chitinispirillaceae bacterium]|nr:formylglycine-generating enzyme family protein [Chitinispirillaceae bacterium]
MILLFLAVILTALSCTNGTRNNPFDTGGTNALFPARIIPEGFHVNINDSLIVFAALNTDGTAVRYLWAISGDDFSDTTASGSRKVAFADSGMHLISVIAVAGGDIASYPATCSIHVTLDPPVVVHQADTTISSTATPPFMINVVASDVNTQGSIIRYYWDAGADGWDDSSGSAVITLSTPTGGTVPVRWAARDDDGLFSFDTFTLHFNRPPSNPGIKAPSIRNWRFFSIDSGFGTLAVKLFSMDPDGPADTPSYHLLTGPDTVSLLQAASCGSGTVCCIGRVFPSRLLWYRLVVKDPFGDSAVTIGHLFAPEAPLPPAAGMVLIRAADSAFQMGSATGAPDERPVHPVRLTCDFWMDGTEVTQREYTALMAATYSAFMPPAWKNSYGKGDLFPAYYVNWYDAVLYCNARTKTMFDVDTVYRYTSIQGTPGNDCILENLTIHTDRAGFRLPTEAEWEYACRAGSATDYSWGDTVSADHAWYIDNSGSITHPAGQKLPNGFALFDMSGNVWEWCNDLFTDYREEALSAPLNVTADLVHRIFRGGSWSSTQDLLRCAERNHYIPDYTGNNVGFRVVLPLIDPINK